MFERADRGLTGHKGPFNGWDSLCPQIPKHGGGSELACVRALAACVRKNEGGLRSSASSDVTMTKPKHTWNRRDNNI